MNHIDPAYGANYIGMWVSEISLIKNSGRVIRSFREKKSLLNKIELQQGKTQSLMALVEEEKVCLHVEV